MKKKGERGGEGARKAQLREENIHNMRIVSSHSFSGKFLLDTFSPHEFPTGLYEK